MRLAFAAALLAACTFGTASAQAPAKGDCAPPPKDLVITEVEPGRGDAVVEPRSGVLVNYTGWLYDGCAKDVKGEQFDSLTVYPFSSPIPVRIGGVVVGTLHIESLLA